MARRRRRRRQIWAFFICSSPVKNVRGENSPLCRSPSPEAHPFTVPGVIG